MAYLCPMNGFGHISRQDQQLAGQSPDHGSTENSTGPGALFLFMEFVSALTEKIALEWEGVKKTLKFKSLLRHFSLCCVV